MQNRQEMCSQADMERTLAQERNRVDELQVGNTRVEQAGDG